jgi:hypothetical protein
MSEATSGIGARAVPAYRERSCGLLALPRVSYGYDAGPRCARPAVTMTT